jgi:hypothetical protein
MPVFEKKAAVTYNLRRAVSTTVKGWIECNSPECFSVQAVTLFDLVERVFLEGAFDVVQNVIHMMIIWSGQAGSFSLSSGFKARIGVAV